MKRQSKAYTQRPDFTVYNTVSPPSPTPNNVKPIKERTSPRQKEEEIYNFDSKLSANGNVEQKFKSR